MNLWETEMLRATGYILKNFLQDWKDKNEKGSLSNNNDTGYINVGKTSMEINNSLCNINLTLSAVFKKG